MTAAEKMVGNKMADLMDIKYDRWIITETQIEKVEQILEVEGKSKTEIQEIRNAIVEFASNAGFKRDEKGEATERTPIFQEVWTMMSAVTAVLDRHLYSR
jgi:hypothetical protein